MIALIFLSLHLFSRNIVSNGNVLLVQFVSDLSVTSDGFMASYYSIPRGQRAPTEGGDNGSGPRISSTPTKPRITPFKPMKPVVKATEAPTTTTTTKVPEQPKPRPKPVRPTTRKPEPEESEQPKPGEKEQHELVTNEPDVLNVVQCDFQPQT